MIIYKILDTEVWRKAESAGIFHGAGIDLTDGYIHFSTATQAAETAARHFAGRSGLCLVAIDGDKLGPALKFEPSRGGELFPHLYGPLALDAVLWVKPLSLAEDGTHCFPPLQ
jgi:uncharacterized protein (DUF952 family)